MMLIDPKELAVNAQHVAEILKQLANPYRLMILCALAEQELAVNDLNAQIALSQSALSQHLAKLRKYQLVSTRRESQTIFYSVSDPKIKELLKVLQVQFCQSGMNH